MENAVLNQQHPFTCRFPLENSAFSASYLCENLLSYWTSKKKKSHQLLLIMLKLKLPQVPQHFGLTHLAQMPDYAVKTLASKECLSIRRECFM